MQPVDFWEDLRERWRHSVALIDGSEDGSVAPVLMKRMWRYSLRRTTVPIMLTGTRGCGKSTLHDALLDRISDDYRPPGKSPRMAIDKAVLRGASRGRRVRSTMYVIPGQSDLRRGEASVYFKGGNYPAGIIHVVARGFGTPWADAAGTIRRELQARGPDDFAAAQKHQQDLELAAFKELCSLLRVCWSHRSDIWLVIAVAKCDLYWDQLSTVEKYYLPRYPEFDSPFYAELRGLVNFLGENSLSKVAIAPVCAYPEPYQFDTGFPEQASQLSAAKSHVSVRNLRSIVGEFCGQ